MDVENENGASIDNEYNNNNDEINGVIAPIIQNSPPHPLIEGESSSKSFRPLMTTVMEMQAILDVLCMPNQYM